MFQPFQPWLPGPPLRSDGTPWHWPPTRKSRNPKLDGDINNYDSCTMEKISWRGEKLHYSSRIPESCLENCWFHAVLVQFFCFVLLGLMSYIKSGQAGYSLPGYGDSKEWKGHEQILLWNMFKQLLGVKPSKWNHPKLIWLRKWDGRGIWSCSEAKRCEAPEYQKPSTVSMIQQLLWTYTNYIES